MKATLISRINQANFRLLILFVHLAHLESFQDLLLWEPRKPITSGTEIFKLLNEFLTENSILWHHFVDARTDDDWYDVWCNQKNKKPRVARVATVYFTNMIL